MKEYDLLTGNGNIGFYNSCEITELVIMESNKIYNLYTICVFQEKKVTPKKHKCNEGLCNRIKIDDNHSIGIFQYELKLKEIKENFEKLKNEYKWISNHKDESSINYPNLKKLNKQFIPSSGKNRLNYVLKNNFFSGSYILEFFDEKKQFEFLTSDEELFEKISEKIRNYLPINLFKIRDRLGNFIFQYPVNILNVQTIASNSSDSLNLNFQWHPSIKKNRPDCILEVDSLLDNNHVGNTIEEYNKNKSQEVYVGNVDSLINVKIWRKNSNLILYSYSDYPKKLVYSTSLGNLKKRYFIYEDNQEFIDLYSKDFESSSDNQEYYEYIKNSIDIKEKKLLEKTLSFKQYTPFHEKHEGLRDLKRLIRENGRNGVYIWDPYLEFEGIINTLFYCPFEGVELKALCSKNSDVRKFYFNNQIQDKIENMSQELNSIQDFCLNEKEVLNLITSLKNNIKHINEYFMNNDNVGWINEQKKLFRNLKSNFEGLNLEFRFQNGKAHDRFLIFPGNTKRYEQPKVYSLGTSVNSFGTNYHILQKVSHPQAVIQEFNKNWDKSKKPENIIWKYPQ